MRAFLLFLAVCATSVAASGVTFCYWGTWSYYRTGLGAYGVSNLPTNLCTHLVWTFIGVDSETAEILELEPQGSENGLSNNITQFIDLRLKTPELKLVVASGGWSAGSVNYSIIANNETLRAKFVENTVAYLEKYDFDVFDLDWEYPTQRNGSESDLEAFVYLLQDLKTAFNGNYGLTVAVGADVDYIGSTYLVPNISATVDYINMMSYDYYGYSLSNYTGVNTPLYSQLTDDKETTINVNKTIHAWIAAGAEPSKILLGLGNYGKTFTLESLDDVATGAPFTGAGEAGNYTQEEGTLAYYEICLGQINDEWNVTEVAGNYVYANKGLQWVGYDNPNTMYAKGQYAKQMGLAGVMFWAIDLDDFANYCGGNSSYPLIIAAVEGYKNG